LEWLDNAQNQGEVQFKSGQWADMHGGKTSASPHCRPQGLMSQREETKNKKKVKWTKFEVRLRCAPDDEHPDKKKTVVEPTMVGKEVEGDNPAAPTVAAVYAVLIAGARNYDP
jgi:hypothetical protein